MATFDHPESETIYNYIAECKRTRDASSPSLITLLRENFDLSAREACEALAAAREERRAAG
jgi:hypothetical protein